jgi:hypothetical protein
MQGWLVSRTSPTKTFFSAYSLTVRKVSYLRLTAAIM